MKTALITGASFGIGEQIAYELSRQGYRLILVARNKEKLNELSKQFKDSKIIALDLCDEISFDYLMKEIKDENIEVLINNAGVGYYGSFESLEENDIQRMIDLNIVVLTKLCYKIIPLMPKSSYVLNVSSTAAFQSGPLFSVYAATKAYVLSLSESLSVEYKDKHISVLCPGPTKTEFDQKANVVSSKIRDKMMMDAKKVAQCAIKGLFNNKTVIIPGMVNKCCVFASNIVPRSITNKIMKNSRIK